MILEIVVAGIVLFGLFILAANSPKMAIAIVLLILVAFAAKCAGAW